MITSYQPIPLKLLPLSCSNAMSEKIQTPNAWESGWLWYSTNRCNWSNNQLKIKITWRPLKAWSRAKRLWRIYHWYLKKQGNRAKLFSLRSHKASKLSAKSLTSQNRWWECWHCFKDTKNGIHCKSHDLWLQYYKFIYKQYEEHSHNRPSIISRNLRLTRIILASLQLYCVNVRPSSCRRGQAGRIARWINSSLYQRGTKIVCQEQRHLQREWKFHHHSCSFPTILIQV